jgi:hypothetical protein
LNSVFELRPANGVVPAARLLYDPGGKVVFSGGDENAALGTSPILRYAPKIEKPQNRVFYAPESDGFD